MTLVKINSCKGLTVPLKVEVITRSSGKLGALPIFNIQNKLQLFLAEPLNNASGGVSILNVCSIFTTAAFSLILFQL